MTKRKPVSEVSHGIHAGSEGKCPRCGNDKAITLDTRVAEFEGVYARRRRKACKECDHRWRTWEIAETDLQAMKEPHPKAIRRAVLSMLDGMKSA